jgi:hypothetical protein
MVFIHSALPLSLPGNTSVSIAGEVDAIKAAPAPCIVRKAMSCRPLDEILHRKEADVNMANPEMKKGFLPLISESLPILNSITVRAAKYAVGTQIAIV